MKIDKVSIPEGRAGDWAVEHFEVSPTQACLFNVKQSGDGHGNRRISPGKHTRLVCHGHTVMSDTDVERLDHEPAYENAQGDCLILGLGLGMLASAIIEKPEVRSVTVVELNRDVARLVQPHIDRRIVVVLADAMNYETLSTDVYDMVWADIWSDISPHNIPSMQMLRAVYENRCDWFGARAEEECMEMWRQKLAEAERSAAK